MDSIPLTMGMRHIGAASKQFQYFYFAKHKKVQFSFSHKSYLHCNPTIKSILQFHYDYENKHKLEGFYHSYLFNKDSLFLY